MTFWGFDLVVMMIVGPWSLPLKSYIIYGAFNSSGDIYILTVQYGAMLLNAIDDWCVIDAGILRCMIKGVYHLP